MDEIREELKGFVYKNFPGEVLEAILIVAVEDEDGEVRQTAISISNEAQPEARKIMLNTALKGLPE